MAFRESQKASAGNQMGMHLSQVGLELFLGLKTLTTVSDTVPLSSMLLDLMAEPLAPGFIRSIRCGAVLKGA
jgi:hypothetical protein